MDIKKDIQFTRNIKCSDVYTESAVEYVLPDYLGDVRKILFTDAALRPSGRFAGGDEVEFSGVVVYNVIYLDSENNLSSAEFTSDYDYSVKCSGENYKDSLSDTRVSNYALRLMGPRKISARASLVGSVKLTENGSISLGGSALEGDNSPEVSIKSLQVRSSSLSSVTEREYAEPVARLDGAISDEVTVVYSDAEATADSLEIGDDSVRVKGRLRMLAVVKNGDSPAYLAEKAVGFEESIPFDGVSESMRLIPELTVTSLKSSVNADEGGSEVVLSGIVEFCILGEKNESLEVASDGYLKSAPTENFYQELSYTSLVDAASVRGSHNAELDRSDIDSEGLHEVVFLRATPKVERIEKGDGNVNIIGEVRYSGIAVERNEDDVSYVSLKFASPFASNVSVGCKNDDNISVDAKVVAHSASASLDSSKLYAGCTLECGVVVYREESENILASLEIKDGESYESQGARITVYYPTDGDTLFSVAKRFHTSTLKVAADNAIAESVFAADNPEGSLAGVKKLLIY